MIDLQFPPAEALGPPRPAAAGARIAIEAPAPGPLSAGPPYSPVPQRDAIPEIVAASESSNSRPKSHTLEERRVEKSAPAGAQRSGGTPGEGNAQGGEGLVATGNNVEEAEVQGEGLALRSNGTAEIDAAYLKNVIRQINRFFRKPDEARRDVAEVAFWLHRNGSVSDIEVIKHRASFAFRIAAMEAVEQPGQKGLFGPLPEGFREDRVRISFTFEPSS